MEGGYQRSDSGVATRHGNDDRSDICDDMGDGTNHSYDCHAVYMCTATAKGHVELLKPHTSISLSCCEHAQPVSLHEY